MLFFLSPRSHKNRRAPPPHANLYPPGVWFADVMPSFSGPGVTFVLFCFFFVCIICYAALKPRPFVQSFFVLRSSICMRPDSRITHVSTFSPFLEMPLFPSIFVPLLFLSLYKQSTLHVFPFRMVFFYLATTGWIFDIISVLLCENFIYQQLNRVRPALIPCHYYCYCLPFRLLMPNTRVSVFLHLPKLIVALPSSS